MRTTVSISRCRPAALARLSGGAMLVAATLAASPGFAQEEPSGDSGPTAPKPNAGDVASASGTFSQSVAIATPAFRGLTPELALSYDSSGGNGYAGVGWGLSGFSTIERVGPTLGTPTYGAGDRYLLGGLELVPCALAKGPSASCSTGGTHTPRIETYERVSFASNTWTIWSPDGTQTLYSPIDAPLWPSGKWGISARIDIHNNRVDYSWTGLHPNKITYNGNTIQLFWETRSDVETRANGTPAPTRFPDRLTKIEVLVGTQLARRYVLTYGMSATTARSQLQAVREYGWDGVASLPATTFTYQGGGAAFASIPDQLGNTERWPQGGQLNGDINGDGRQDFCGVFADFCGASFNDAGKFCTTNGECMSNTCQCTAWSPEGFCTTGYCTDPGCGPDIVIACLSSHVRCAVSNGSGFTIKTVKSLPDTLVSTLRLADVTGDGKDDLCMLRAADYAYALIGGVVCYAGDPTSATGFGGNVANVQLPNWIMADFGYYATCDWWFAEQAIQTLQFVDINRDGLADVCAQWPSGIGCHVNLGSGVFSTTPIVASGFSYAAGFGPGSPTNQTQRGHWNNYPTIRYPDINGDGMADICGRHDSEGIRCQLSSGSAFGPAIQGPAFTDSLGWGGNDNYVTIQYPDINGDGKADVCGRHDALGIVCHLSTGSGFGAALYGPPWHNGNGWSSNAKYIWYPDLNGDGKADICGRGDAAMVCYGSTGAGFNGFSTSLLDYRTATATFAGVRPASISFSDWTGDGKADVCAHRRVSSDKPPFQCFTATQDGVESVRSVTNLLGGVTSVTYLPSSAFPNTNNPPLTHVVSTLTTNDGRGTATSAATTIYTYANGFYDHVERRFLGFGEVRVTQPCLAGESTCPYTRTVFAQDRASAGKPLSIENFDGRFTIPNNYKTFEYTANATTIPYTSLPSGEWSYNYDGGGTLCVSWPCALARRTYVARTSFDAYGNVLSEVAYGDRDVNGGSDIQNERVTTTERVNNTSNYVVGLPGRVMTTTMGGTKLTETRNYYDNSMSYLAPPTVGDLTKTEVWKDPGNRFIASRREYDTYGNLKREITSPDGGSTLYETVYTYDPTYNVFALTVTDAEGMVVTNQWDFVCGEVKSMSDDAGREVSTAYDPLCRRERADQPNGAYERYVYENLGSPGGSTPQFVEVRTPGPAGYAELWSRTYMDGLGRTYRTRKTSNISDLAYIETVTGYDRRGNVASLSNPYYPGDPVFLTTTFYDGLDRTVMVKHPDNHSVSTAYAFNSTTTIDELGHRTVNITDVGDHRVERQEQLETKWHSTKYEYDSGGRLAVIIDALLDRWTQQVNTLGQVVQVRDPNAGTWAYEYDDLGRKTAQVDGLSQRTEWTYDRINRKRTETQLAGTPQAETTIWAYGESQSGGYSNRGRLLSVTNPAAQLLYDYDVAGNRVRTRDVVGGQTHTFESRHDLGGRLLWRRYPDGQLLGSASSPIAYDAAGNMRLLPGVARDGLYDASGRLVEQRNDNNTVTTFDYDPARGWLDGILTQAIVGGQCTCQLGVCGETGTMTTIENVAYARDEEGKIRQVVSPGRPLEEWVYDYDDLHRVTSANNADGTLNDQTFTYNEIGNITFSTRAGTYTYPAPGAASVRPQAVSRITKNGVATDYGYDNDGRMTTVTIPGSPTRTFTWTGDNRPKTISTGATTVSFVYDGDGERIKKVVGSQVTVTLGEDYEIAPAGTVTKYFSFAGRTVAKSVGTDKFWMHSDHQGSTHTITNTSGGEVQRLAYHPYGERLLTNTSHPESLGYTGERQDAETGLFYLHARYYDPSIGRFISADPSVPSADSVGLNRYAYARNNPVSNTDPSGLQSQPPKWMQLRDRFFQLLNRFLDVPGMAAMSQLETVHQGGEMLGAAVSGENPLKVNQLGHQIMHPVETVRETATSMYTGGKVLVTGIFSGDLDMIATGTGVVFTGAIGGTASFMSVRKMEVTALGLSASTRRTTGAVLSPLWGSGSSGSPITNAGPMFEGNTGLAARGVAGLPDDIAQTFAGGKYHTRVLQQDVVAYRYSGGTSKPPGRFLTTRQTVEQIDSPADAQRLLNLPSGATAERLDAFVIPRGTTLYYGRVAGGGKTATQLFIYNPALLWPTP